MNLETYLISIGVNISSSYLYDFLKDFFGKYENPTQDQLKDKLNAFLSIQNNDIKTNLIINFLAEKGDILIENSKIYASKSITIHADVGASFVFGNNSTSSTEKTSITSGDGAYIIGQNGAGIVQNEDGSINFYTKKS